MAITVKHSNFFNGGRALIKRLAYFAFLFYLFLPIINYAQSKDDKVCLECHGDRTFTTTRDGKVVSSLLTANLLPALFTRRLAAPVATTT